MIEFITIKDTKTNNSLTVLRQPPDTHYIVIGNSDPEEVRKASVGKAIRAWMKGVKKEK